MKRYVGEKYRTPLPAEVAIMDMKKLKNSHTATEASADVPSRLKRRENNKPKETHIERYTMPKKMKTSVLPISSNVGSALNARTPIPISMKTMPTNVRAMVVIPARNLALITESLCTGCERTLPEVPLEISRLTVSKVKMNPNSGAK
jgi:hypothetical protein